MNTHHSCRTLFFSIFLFYLCSNAVSQTFPTITLVDNGPLNNRINLAYLGDGYTLTEQTQYLSDVTEINQDLFTQAPFSNYANFFNAFAVQVPSAQSGADHPGTATDITEPVHEIQSVNTYFDGTFDFAGIHRLLVTTNNTAIFNVLADNVPAYDQAMLIVNSMYYGGSGGQNPCASTHEDASEIAIHELGHSFADLSDEYYAGDQYAQESFNMTQETDPNLVRWTKWYGTNGVGIYQHCCGGNSTSWYRPHENCKMRFLGSPFCAVCTQRIIDRIYELVIPIDNYAPAASTLENMGIPLEFTLDLVYPDPNTLKIEWVLNDEIVATDQNGLTLSTPDFMIGENVLTVKISDETPLSKTYEDGYQFSVTWTISNAISCENELSVTDDPIPAGIYQAAVQISSASTVATGSEVEFRAGNQILLEEGFTVPGDATVFTASIAGCDDP